jgi:hypothetical protein
LTASGTATSSSSNGDAIITDDALFTQDASLTRDACLAADALFPQDAMSQHDADQRISIRPINDPRQHSTTFNDFHEMPTFRVKSGKPVTTHKIQASIPARSTASGDPIPLDVSFDHFKAKLEGEAFNKNAILKEIAYEVPHIPHNPKSRRATAQHTKQQNDTRKNVLTIFTDMIQLLKTQYVLKDKIQFFGSYKTLANIIAECNATANKFTKIMTANLTNTQAQTITEYSEELTRVLENATRKPRIETPPEKLMTQAVAATEIETKDAVKAVSKRFKTKHDSNSDQASKEAAALKKAEFAKIVSQHILLPDEKTYKVLNDRRPAELFPGLRSKQKPRSGKGLA